MQKMQNEEETVMANVEKIEQFNDSLLEVFIWYKIFVKVS